MTIEILEIIDRGLSKPLKKTPKISLRFLQVLYAGISVTTIWYIFFGAWFIRGAGEIYAGVTIALALVLAIAYFYESDGRGWKNFATLCVICAAPRLLFSPIYAVANIQTSNVNGSMIFIEEFHSFWGFEGIKHSEISHIWFVYYYNFMLIIISIQRVWCRKAVEEKKQKIYAENLKEQENKRTEQAAGPLYM